MSAKKDRFLSVWPRIRAELVQFLKDNHMPPDATSWFERSLQYNVPGGKLNRGISVVDTVEIMRGARLGDDEYFEVALLGWGVELLQAFFLVSDDLMDSSVTRRDQACWYRVEQPDKVGTIAVNDAFMLEGAIYHLLKRYFRKRSFYADLLDLYHDMTYYTELGQLIDLITAPEDKIDLSKFSLIKHRLIVIYKTAYYSFYLPVALAMIYVGVPVPDEMPTLARTLSFDGTPTPTTTSGLPAVSPYHVALDILLPLGEYFQVQDDYLDCFGVDIGKIGTDILDNKCSWVVCTALKFATPEQLSVLSANYGRKSASAEAKCKAIFEELNIRERYTEYEENAYKRIGEMINVVEEQRWGEVVLRREIFRSFIGKIYKRQK
ncbi:farnesyl-diphosphate synthase [Hysterangium stoloniferum]|nr:farnesyl-diphosphate synthase [Hysterangium stoloniferum]